MPPCPGGGPLPITLTRMGYLHGALSLRYGELGLGRGRPGGR